MPTTPAPPELLWHEGMLVDVALDGARTGGAYAVLDIRAARGTGSARHLHDATGPIVFNFFPAVGADGTCPVEGNVLRSGRVRFEASRGFSVNREFRIMNPYAFEFTYEHKPVRCWKELEPGKTFVVAIRVD